jgi:hypothetical protein
MHILKISMLLVMAFLNAVVTVILMMFQSGSWWGIFWAMVNVLSMMFQLRVAASLTGVGR